MNRGRSTSISARVRRCPALGSSPWASSSLRLAARCSGPALRVRR